MFFHKTTICVSILCQAFNPGHRAGNKTDGKGHLQDKCFLIIFSEYNVYQVTKAGYYNTEECSFIFDHIAYTHSTHNYTIIFFTLYLFLSHCPVIIHPWLRLPWFSLRIPAGRPDGVRDWGCLRVRKGKEKELTNVKHVFILSHGILIIYGIDHNINCSLQMRKQV